MCMRMCRDRNSGSLVCLSYSSKNTFDTGGDALQIGGAFQHSGFDASVGDSFLDIFDEHVYHRLITAENGTRPLIVKVKRNIVVGIDAGGDNDVEIGLRCYSLYSRNVSSESDDGEIYDCINASGFEFIQPLDCIRDTFFFVSPRAWIVLHDFG